jgi:hypothetical protein
MEASGAGKATENARLRPFLARGLAMNDSDLVVAYLAHAETRTRDGTDAEHFAAAEELDSLLSDKPERAWPIICEIIRGVSDDDILAYVAAGPLEDLLVRHPHAFIDRVEALAMRDPHFRRALSGVWGWNSIPSEVRQRLDQILGDEPRL